MKALTICMVLTVIVSQHSDSNEKLNASDQIMAKNNRTDNMPTTLTITKLKKPGFAWRGLVVGKMRKTIPDYKNVEGLSQKYYALTSDQKSLGGIYVWESVKASENWFDDKWHERVQKKYGEKGIVLTYAVLKEKTFRKPDNNTGRFCAALSITSKNEDLSWSNHHTGLIKVFELKNEKNTTCYLSIWERKDNAEPVLNVYGVTNEYFDVPIILKTDN